MARWAGEGNDWIKVMAHRKARKEDVIRSLLESMKRAVDGNTEPNGTSPTKKPRDLPPLEIERPEAGQRRTLEIKGDCKSIVDLDQWPCQDENESKHSGEYSEPSARLVGRGEAV